MQIICGCSRTSRLMAAGVSFLDHPLFLEVRTVCFVQQLNSGVKHRDTRECVQRRQEMGRKPRWIAMKGVELAYRGQAVLPKLLPPLLVSSWLTLSYIMHPALEVKMTFGMGRCVRTRSQAPLVRLVSCRNIHSQVILFTTEIVLNFWTLAFSVSMHPLCVSMNNITFPFLFFDIISVNNGLWEQVPVWHSEM